jgi:hypothetical protein
MRLLLSVLVCRSLLTGVNYGSFRLPDYNAGLISQLEILLTSRHPRLCFGRSFFFSSLYLSFIKGLMRWITTRYLPFFSISQVSSDNLAKNGLTFSFVVSRCQEGSWIHSQRYTIAFALIISKPWTRSNFAFPINCWSSA